MATQNVFYGLPKERLANLLNCPSSLNVYGDLVLEYQGRARHGRITLSDFLMPELSGRGPGVLHYVPIGTRVEINAGSTADLSAVKAHLDRVAKQYEI